MLPRMLRHAPEYAAAWMSLNFLSNGLRSVLLHPDDGDTSSICENFRKYYSNFNIDVSWAHPPWFSTEINELIVLSHINVGIVSSHHKEYPLFLAANSFLWTVCISTGFHSVPFYKVQHQSGENEVMQYSFKTEILRNIFVEAHCGDFPIHSVSQSAEKRAFLSEWRYLKSSAKKMGWYCSRRVGLLVKA